MHFLVVDDHDLFRDGLKLTLQAAFPGAQVAEAGSLEQARAAFGAPAFDLALIDLSLPGGGWRIIESLLAIDPALPVAVVSATEDYGEVLTARARGAAAFIPKHFPRQWFIAAVRSVLAGAAVFPSREEFLLGAPTHREGVVGALPDGLTPRQAEVLEGMIKGWSNKEIGRALGLAEKTVKVHVSAILSVLDVNNRTEAVARILAQREGR